MLRQVPNQPATPNRTIRVADELWAEVRWVADDMGTTLTAVVLAALRDYVRRYKVRRGVQ